MLVTLTIPHYAGDSLRTLLVEISKAYNGVIGTPSYSGSTRMVGLKREIGIIGAVRSLEVTHGRNGWHPHLHILVLTDHVLLDHEVGEAWTFYERLWARQVKKRFDREIGTHGVDIRPVSAGDSGGTVAAYVAKLQEGAGTWGIGAELTRADLKIAGRESLTPFELLAVATDKTHSQKRRAVVLWREWESATRGRQCITFTNGLRELLGITSASDAELADDEDPTELPIAAEGVTAQPPEISVFAEVRGDAYLRLHRAGLTGHVLDLVERAGTYDEVAVLVEAVCAMAGYEGRAVVASVAERQPVGV